MAKKASFPAESHEGERRVRVEYVPLAALLRAPRNPKAHDAEMIDASIRRFGYVEPLLEDERTGRLVAGHGRLEALLSLKEAGGEAPAGIIVEAGEWRVPTLRGVRFDTDAEAEAYLLAANRISERGGWDAAELAASLSWLASEGAGLEGLGYDDADLAALTEALGGDYGAGSEGPEPAGGAPPGTPPSPPGEFKEFGEDIAVEYRCPACHYAWSGNPLAGSAGEESPGVPGVPAPAGAG